MRFFFFFLTCHTTWYQYTSTVLVKELRVECQGWTSGAVDNIFCSSRNSVSRRFYFVTRSFSFFVRVQNTTDEKVGPTVSLPTNRKRSILRYHLRKARKNHLWSSTEFTNSRLFVSLNLNQISSSMYESTTWLITFEHKSKPLPLSLLRPHLTPTRRARFPIQFGDRRRSISRDASAGFFHIRGRVPERLVFHGVIHRVVYGSTSCKPCGSCCCLRC